MKPQPTKLAAIATTMTNQTQTTGRHAYTRLPQGLEIVMQRIDGRWRLALAREEPATPSQAEIEQCYRDFHVPAEASLNYCQKNRQHPKTGRRITYNVFEITWREVTA